MQYTYSNKYNTGAVAQELCSSCINAVLKEGSHCHRTDVPVRHLTLQAENAIRFSGWRLRAAGLEHRAPGICNLQVLRTIDVNFFWPPERNFS